jgi:hypothetical protein
LSISFTSPKGQPVVIRRPDLIASLTGYQRHDRETGELRDHTAVIFESGQVVFVSGHAEVIGAAIADHQRNAWLDAPWQPGKLESTEPVPEASPVEIDHGPYAPLVEGSV